MSWRPAGIPSGSVTCERLVGASFAGVAAFEPFRPTEMPDSEKPRVIEAYLARWGNQVKKQFETLPDPADHPVFRIEPL